MKTTKSVWHYHNMGNKLVADVANRKVVHVVQNKRSSCLEYCFWTGELDDDRYFLIGVLNGIVMLTVAEREDELRTKDCTVVAYADGIMDAMTEPDELYRIQKLILAKTKFLPNFMANLTFEEIMGIFMWEYASPTVEVYEHLLV